MGNKTELWNVRGKVIHPADGNLPVTAVVKAVDVTEAVAAFHGLFKNPTVVTSVQVVE